jgi:hypothetical protein
MNSERQVLWWWQVKESTAKEKIFKSKKIPNLDAQKKIQQVNTILTHPKLYNDKNIRKIQNFLILSWIVFFLPQCASISVPLSDSAVWHWLWNGVCSQPGAPFPVGVGRHLERRRIWSSKYNLWWRLLKFGPWKFQSHTIPPFNLQSLPSLPSPPQCTAVVIWVQPFVTYLLWWYTSAVRQEVQQGSSGQICTPVWFLRWSCGWQ